MLRQIICQYCGLDFEVLDSPDAGKIFCPNCANEIDSKRAQAIVEATTHFQNPDVVLKVSRALGEPMVGINISDIPESERLAQRGW